MERLPVNGVDNLIFFYYYFYMEEKKQDPQKAKPRSAPTQVGATTGEIERLKKELEEERKRAEEYLNGWKRSKADYLNLEKEVVEEKIRFIKLANLEFIIKILPILDSFKKLIEHLSPEIKNSDWGKGLLQFEKQLEKFLKEIGLEKIRTLNEKFNPLFHEVIDKKGESDKIIEEIETGFLLNGEVIRPAKVVIG